MKKLVNRLGWCLGVLWGVFACVRGAVAQQPQHARTVIVDQSTQPPIDWNFSTIQEAINAVNAHPETEGVWTILVYPGVYHEAITLGARKFIEIQGVARDAVVINPQPGVNGITLPAITFAGAQLGPVNYRIADLTIRTNDDDQDQGDAVVFNFDPVIDPPPNPPTPNGIIFDNVLVAVDGRSSDGFKAISGVADVTLRGVTIRAAAFTSNPLKGQLIQGLKVHDCDFLAVDGMVELGNDADVRDSRIVVDRTFGSAVSAQDDTAAIRIQQASRVMIRNTYLEGRYAGLLLQGTSKTIVRDCVLRGANYGVVMSTNDHKWGISPGASDVMIENCSIYAESSRGALDPGIDNMGHPKPPFPYRAVAVQSPLGPVTLRGCEIMAVANRLPTAGNPTVAASSEGVVVETDANGIAPVGGAVVLEGCSILAVAGPDGGTDATGVSSYAKSGIVATNCTISARQTWLGDTTTPRKAYGVLGAFPEAVSLVGGRISSFDVNERENDQYDVRSDSTSEVRVRVHGTALSKWKGVVGSSERQRVDVQRMVSVAAPSTTAILPAKPLSSMEQVFTKPDFTTQPDNYRVLTATLTGIQAPGVTFPVTIVGTNWSGEQISDTANVTSTTEFVKPFRTVTKIFLPPNTSGTHAISIGTSSRLGLHTPLTDGSDLLLVSKSVNGAAFLPETFNLADFDFVNHTLKIPTITAGASYEITYRASE